MLTTTDEKKPLCRFDMFTRLKKGCPPPVKNGKEFFTYRGDMYYNEPDKMLKTLIRMVENHRKKCAVMMIRDNSKPASSHEQIVLKLINGKPCVNRILSYPELIQDYPLPKYLSYSITPDEEEEE